MRTLLVIELVPEETRKYIIEDDGGFYSKYNELSQVVFGSDEISDHQGELAEDLNSYIEENKPKEMTVHELKNIDNIVWHTILL